MERENLGGLALSANGVRGIWPLRCTRMCTIARLGLYTRLQRYMTGILKYAISRYRRLDCSSDRVLRRSAVMDISVRMFRIAILSDASARIREVHVLAPERHVVPAHVPKFRHRCIYADAVGAGHGLAASQTLPPCPARSYARCVLGGTKHPGGDADIAVSMAAICDVRRVDRMRRRLVVRVRGFWWLDHGRGSILVGRE